VALDPGRFIGKWQRVAPRANAERDAVYKFLELLFDSSQRMASAFGFHGKSIKLEKIFRSLLDSAGFGHGRS